MDSEDMQKMVMVNKGGMSYWVPMSDKQNSISNYNKWDQAFRVYLDIYTSKYPECTSELIQYGHMIQTATFSYAWENVALYDREFRRHMERYPDHICGVILQQAWTMFLKDRVNGTPSNSNKFNNNHVGEAGSTGRVDRSGSCAFHLISMENVVSGPGASLIIDAVFVENSVMAPTTAAKRLLRGLS